MTRDEKPVTGEAIKTLFAEWTKDYEAAKVRDTEGEFADLLAQPTKHPDPQPERDNGNER